MYEVMVKTESGNVRSKRTDNLQEAKAFADLCAGKYRSEVMVIREQKLCYLVKLSVYFDIERNVAR